MTTQWRMPTSRGRFPPLNCGHEQIHEIAPNRARQQGDSMECSHGSLEAPGRTITSVRPPGLHEDTLKEQSGKARDGSVKGVGRKSKIQPRGNSGSAAPSSPEPSPEPSPVPGLCHGPCFCSVLLLLLIPLGLCPGSDLSMSLAQHTIHGTCLSSPQTILPLVWPLSTSSSVLDTTIYLCAEEESIGTTENVDKVTK